RLAHADPETYGAMDVHNTQRVIRALEFYESTGQKLSDFRTGNRKDRPFNIIKIGLNMEREHLYERINERVDQMMVAGLLEEVQSLPQQLGGSTCSCT
ncbi:MAG: tRNA (adenosine(37)-N6)-dimethylallyltransferase MiaA, partial [Cytophagaceae bacterium]